MVKGHWATWIKGSEVFSHTAAEHRSSCSCRDLHGVPPPTQILILLTIGANVGKVSQSWGGWNKPVQLSTSQRCPKCWPMVTPIPDHRVFICFKIMSDKSKIRSLAMELLTPLTGIDSNPCVRLPHARKGETSVTKSGTTNVSLVSAHRFITHSSRCRALHRSIQPWRSEKQIFPKQ